MKVINYRFVLLLAITLACFVWHTADVQAQSIDLSIYPPITEIMIQPGKEVTQSFSIGNGASGIVLTPKVVYFEPNDENGGAMPTDQGAPNWVVYDRASFSLESGSTKEFRLKFAPPQNETERDHLLTIIFESGQATDLTNQNSVFLKSQIAANILITISKDGKPQTSAEILKFSGPKIIDSTFSDIAYDITIKNDGNSYWKPGGKITINGQEELDLAPQNILSGYSRQMMCIEDQKLINCILERPFLGISRARLSFKIPGSEKEYFQEFETFSLPFTAILVLILLLVLTRVVRRYHSVKG